jgi:hypothetical protein
MTIKRFCSFMQPGRSSCCIQNLCMLIRGEPDVVNMFICDTYTEQLTKRPYFYSSCLLNLTLVPEVGGTPLVGRLSRTLAEQLCSISRDLSERLPYRGAGDQQNMAQNYFTCVDILFQPVGFVGLLLTNYTTGYFTATPVSGYFSTLQFSLSLLSKVKFPDHKEIQLEINAVPSNIYLECVVCLLCL